MGLLTLFTVAALLIIAVGTWMLIRALVRPDRKTIGYALAKGYPTDPEDIDLPGEPITFHFDDHYSSPGWVVRGHNPDGPMVVVTHGWSSSRFASLAKALQFSPYASKIVVYDLRAHGDSTAPLCLHGKKEVDDLLAVLEQVDDEQRGIVLYGSSMGAGFSIVAAARDNEHGPGRVVGVIADGAYRFPLRPIIGQVRRRGAPGFPFAHLALAHLVFWHGPYDHFDRADHAAKIRGPMMVLHGDADDICPIKGARIIAAAAPSGWIVEFPGASHGGLAEFDEARYAEALRVFFARVRIFKSQQSETFALRTSTDAATTS